MGYDSLSRKRSAVLSDASHWDYTYDVNGQLQGAQRSWADGLPVAGQQFGYVYDQAGNRMRTQRNGQGANSRESSYTADNANRYNNRTVLGYVNIIGTADAGATVSATVGANHYRAERHGTYFRCEVPVPTGADPEITIRGVKPDGGTDRITTTTAIVNVPPATQSFTYDTDGNLKTDGVWTYTWDGENRLKTMERLNKTLLTFTYDYAGRRVKKSVQQWTGSAYGTAQITRFLYDGWHLVAELAATDTLVRGYVWGMTAGGALDPSQGVGALVMVRSGSTIHFVTQDPFGNVAGLVNASSGVLEGRFEYTPFGEMIQASGTAAAACPIRFSNKYWDSESGLVYYGYRYYSPSLGRWVNRDPIEELAGENLYRFVLNTPLEFIDILGREPGRFGSPDRDHAYYKQTHQGRPGPLVPALLLSFIDNWGFPVWNTGETEWFLRGDPRAVEATKEATKTLSDNLNRKLCGKAKGMPRLSYVAGDEEGESPMDFPMKQGDIESSYVLGYYEYRVRSCSNERDGNIIKWKCRVVFKAGIFCS